MYKLLVFDPFNVILNVVKYINLINILLMQSLRESPMWVYTCECVCVLSEEEGMRHHCDASNTQGESV